MDFWIGLLLIVQALCLIVVFVKQHDIEEHVVMVRKLTGRTRARFSAFWLRSTTIDSDWHELKVEHMDTKTISWRIGKDFFYVRTDYGMAKIFVNQSGFLVDLNYVEDENTKSCQRNWMHVQHVEQYLRALSPSCLDIIAEIPDDYRLTSPPHLVKHDDAPTASIKTCQKLLKIYGNYRVIRPRFLNAWIQLKDDAKIGLFGDDLTVKYCVNGVWKSHILKLNGDKICEGPFTKDSLDLEDVVYVLNLNETRRYLYKGGKSEGKRKEKTVEVEGQEV